MKDNLKTAVIIVAAGSGNRMNDKKSAKLNNQQNLPKQYLKLKNKAVINYSLEKFINSEHINNIQPVIRKCDIDLYADCLTQIGVNDKILAPVFGGTTRQSSVLEGLKALLKSKPEYVLIHDAARPFFSIFLIKELIAGLKKFDGAIAASPIHDTIKKTSDNRQIIKTIPRKNTFSAQTPQAFHFEQLLNLSLKAQDNSSINFTDEASLLEYNSKKVTIINSSNINMKITTQNDLELAKAIIEANLHNKII